ncbi:hypothetical protein CCR95_23385 [Thiocystis minor]|nr:hypothetical protein [Thiocystis minor]
MYAKAIAWSRRGWRTRMREHGIRVRHPRLAGQEAPYPPLSHPARVTVGALDLRMNRRNQGQPLAVGQPFAIELVTALPGPVAADADLENLTELVQGE